MRVSNQRHMPLLRSDYPPHFSLSARYLTMTQKADETSLIARSGRINVARDQIRKLTLSNNVSDDRRFYSLEPVS